MQRLVNLVKHEEDLFVRLNLFIADVDVVFFIRLHLGGAGLAGQAPFAGGFLEISTYYSLCLWTFACRSLLLCLGLYAFAIRPLSLSLSCYAFAFTRLTLP